MISEGANFTTSTVQEHQDVCQKLYQSPVKFDVQLAALESVMEARSDSILASNFFTRLDERLRSKMAMSGREQFPTNRRKMIAFVQRIWQSMK